MCLQSSVYLQVIEEDLEEAWEEWEEEEEEEEEEEWEEWEVNKIYYYLTFRLL